ncbi:uncharacterized protein LOC131332822 [Rhododendron vialii]|uniref:uncharacterized protein LOC131332822 n=1 Tax=Rhododendron vialii TaxID=182163 RepID=UPI00265E4E65|nr:uncharacterized protein LOC131332822 [Rhododendron vialii]
MVDLGSLVTQGVETQRLRWSRSARGGITVTLDVGVHRNAKGGNMVTLVSPRGHGAIWVIVDRLTKSAHFLPIQVTDLIDTLSRLYIHEIICLHGIHLGEATLVGPELIQETSKSMKAIRQCLLEAQRRTTEQVKVIRQRLLTVQSRQKSYADCRRQPLLFQVGDHVFLKVSPRRGLSRFGQRGNLSPHFIRPFDIIEKIGEVAYRLALPPRLSGIHDVFHVSMLWKYEPDLSHILEWSELELEADASYGEEPIRILDSHETVLRGKTIPLV